MHLPTDRALALLAVAIAAFALVVALDWPLGGLESALILGGQIWAAITSMQPLE